MDSRILLLLTILIRTVPFISANNKNYTKCGQLFQCGDIKNIGYPFFGDSRPDYCGHPRFHLTNCQSNGSPTIEINSFNYRIKNIDHDEHIITLVRDDYSTTVCPQFLRNDTVESGAHFSYEPRTSDLVLYYKCSRGAGIPPQPNQLMPCFANNSFIEAYYAMSGVGLNEGVTCETSVSVRVQSDAIVDINKVSFNVTKSVLDGFNVTWNENNGECDECVGKGGRCGSDPGSGTFQCYEKGSSSGKELLIAVSITGAVLSLLGIGLAIFAYKKRKNYVNSVQSSQSDSKDNAFSSISKGLTFTTTPSANFSQSVPSYASSKLDSSKSSSYFGVQVFTYTELEEATNNFDTSRELGEGGFGTVYFGKLKDDRIVAVKRLYENNYKRIEQFMNELDILTRLRHDNLVTLYGCTSRRSRELLLVYEYVPNGTVADHLYGPNSLSTASLSWPTRLKIAVETADALAYLHKSDIIHRDVKTNNILLDNEFKVKVADFGLSRLFPTDVTHVSTAPQGTPGYVDPEYHNCYQLTEKSDVYSFGVVLIELISSKQAVDTNRNRLDINLANMAINRIQNGALRDLVDPFIGFETDSLVRRKITLVAELAFRCLQTERDMRPSMDEVVKALRGIKNGNLGLQQEEVVEIVIEDDVALLKGRSTPVSPRSPVMEKQARNPAVRYSSG